MAKSRNKGGAAAPERLSGIRDAKDRREVTEVFVRAFANPVWMEEHMDRGLFGRPVFDPEHTRVAVADGRVVSAVTMGRRVVRFGPVEVPAMTVGPVGTHDAYRKRGYGAATMHDASRYMQENGYLVAYLQGIPNYYYRFGYYPYMAPGHVRMGRDDAKREGRPGTLRAMTKVDVPAVRRLYDRAAADRICAAARDRDVWDWLMGPGRRTWLFRKPQVILDGQRRLCGYVTGGRENEPGRGEIVVRQDEASCRAALGALVRDARRRERKEIVLPMPWDDAMAVFIRQHVGGEFRMWSNPTGGALLKVVDFPAFMQRLEALLSQRWQRAGSSVRGVRFTLASELGEVGLALSGRSAKVGKATGGPLVRIPQRWLSGLLTGYHAVRHLAAMKGASVPADLIPVMEALFPTGWPFVYSGDNY